MKQQSALYIVATPIGNLSDMTPRAVEVLSRVDVIAAEDTRHSAKLMHHYQISTPLIAYHDHGGDAQTERVLKKLRAGDSVALISDAGTPLISDPGYRLVHCARAEGFEVVPIPGPCALIAALSASGLPSDRFMFEGFTPAKQSARIAVFNAVKTEKHTLIYYESPHRIVDSLADMSTCFGGERHVVVGRELTKTFETFLCGTLCDIAGKVAEDPNQRKGELVVMLAGFVAQEVLEELDSSVVSVLNILREELPLKQASALCAKITGEKKNKIYKWALSDQDN
ncbi:MAG: 16S rRNA (cytidine1402-2'-O)-methyltransferase [Lentisphaeria bacterium]|jgi:16S rRNA (cytidine1402-2'-O)-methyltransferase